MEGKRPSFTAGRDSQKKALTIKFLPNTCTNMCYRCSFNRFWYVKFVVFLNLWISKQQKWMKSSPWIPWASPTNAWNVRLNLDRRRGKGRSFAVSAVWGERYNRLIRLDLPWFGWNWREMTGMNDILKTSYIFSLRNVVSPWSHMVSP